LTERILKLAWEHMAYGYRRATVLLLPEDSKVKVKRVHRIWKREGLQVPRRKARNRRMGPNGEMALRTERPNWVWTYDFLEDRTAEGKKLRILTVLDEYTQECLNITADKVIIVLELPFLSRGVPEYLRSDNGPEFVAKAVQRLLGEKGCKIIYNTPGSPWENLYIESFHDKPREECLNQYLFVRVQETQEMTEAWRQEYNLHRPHSSLGHLIPVEHGFRARMEPREAARMVG